MGGSLHRDSAVRQSNLDKRLKILLLLLAPGFGFLLALGMSKILLSPSTTQRNKAITQPVRKIEAVAALGQLTPSGEVRKLAAPVSGFGGTPRVAQLLINEGDSVTRGQVLAIFDNRPQILADIQGVDARIKTLEIKIVMQKREISRYKEAALQGATPLVLLEEKEDELIKLQGQKEESLAERKGLEADLSNSELKTPIDGIVLRVRARAGERPGSQGVLEVGANQEMEALIEVYESDINRVKIGQLVSLESENGGFVGSLNGKVKLISPQVRQRQVLSTDPTGDADARVVEVRVTLDSKSAELVNTLTGMKVIARFQPL